MIFFDTNEKNCYVDFCKNKVLIVLFVFTLNAAFYSFFAAFFSALAFRASSAAMLNVRCATA
jgi:fumarate reductase subunit C